MKLAESVRIKPDHAVELVLYALLLANVRLHEEEGVEEDGGDKCGEHGPHLQGPPIGHGRRRAAFWGTIRYTWRTSGKHHTHLDS